jgi:hypothetical protein
LLRRPTRRRRRTGRLAGQLQYCYEVHVGAGREVFIANVAPTDDRDAVIDDPRLVMHAMVEARAARKELTHRAQPSAPRAKGIEKTNLDGCMTIERDQGIIVRPCVHVIEQHAHAHAAIGGAQQLAREVEPGRIAAPDVILHFDAALGGLRAHHAQGEGVEPVGDESRAGFALRERPTCPEFIEHRRLWRMRKRVRGRTHLMRHTSAVQIAALVGSRSGLV